MDATDILKIIQLEQREYYRLVNEMLAMLRVEMVTGFTPTPLALLDTIQDSIQRMGKISDKLYGMAGQISDSPTEPT